MNNIKKTLFLFFGLVVIILMGTVYAPDVHAVNYNVQDLIGTYESKSSVCEDGSKIGHLVPCARHCDNPGTENQDETEPCSVCHLIVLGHNIVEYIVFIAVFIAFAIIVFAGVMYIVSAGDQGMIGTAKTALKSALFGIIFVLVAWVLINTLITVFLQPKTGTFQGDWRQYYCESVEGDTDDNPATGDTDDNPATGGTDDNPATGGGTDDNPATGGGTDDNPATGDAAGDVDASGRIKDVNAYTETMYCGVVPTSSGTHYMLDTDPDTGRCQTATTRSVCENAFGKNCVAFEPGAARIVTYPYFHLDVTVDTMVVDTNGDGNITAEEILPIDIHIDEAYQSNTQALDPRQACFDALENLKQINQYIVPDVNCVGVMNK